MKTKLLLTVILVSLCQMSNAQEWMNLHRHDDEGVSWVIPMQTDLYSQFDFSSDGKTLRAYTTKKDGTELVVPFSMEYLDSISFSSSLTDEEKGHNKYRVFTLHIDTEDGAGIVEKETWLNCHFSLDGKGEYSNYSGTGRIRGRGNSSWLYYLKKPYKIKLDSKSKLLGLNKAKNWNLLSNYRDVTDMMNVLAFETARWMGMPYTNHSRFVEVFLNGEYVGVYQLTEKVEIGENRVNIDKVDGLLMSFDVDDGPEESPKAGDNFWSEVYHLPMCVKEPEDLSEEQLNQVKADFAVLERAIQQRDYEKVNDLMDLSSFISILQLHEYLFNVEIAAPRSLYMYKDKEGKYTFGPVWDWDAAYDFSWTDWTVNHTYFSDYRELIFGTVPLKAVGSSNTTNRFFREMFGCPEFVAQYKKAWAERSEEIFSAPWEETQKYVDEMNKGAYARDVARWPLTYPHNPSRSYSVASELEKMKTYLQHRKAYLDGIISAYPDGEGEEESISAPVVEVKDGAIYVAATMQFVGNYTQDYTIDIDRNDVIALLGGEPTALVPIDRTYEDEGWNTAAGRYGAWFDEDGDTADFNWGNVHVYIESNELYSWHYGCHPLNCRVGDTHTVTMQYQRGSRTVDVIVTFTIK